MVVLAMGNQYYKTLYYTDYPAEKTNAKTVTIAFNKSEFPIYQRIKNMSNYEIRELIGAENYSRLVILSKKEDRSINNIIKRQIKKSILPQIDIQASDSTFTNSKIIPFQRWYPYIEGYSPDYVKSLIQKYLPEGVKTIYDPFIGTGTTIFGADDLNINTFYSEVNPLLQFIIDTKISVLKLSVSEREKLSSYLLKTAKDLPQILDKTDVDLQLDRNHKALFGDSRYFDELTYSYLLRMRTYIDKIMLIDNLLGNVVSIAILASLIPISLLKKQGDVRFKTKKELQYETVDFFDFLQAKMQEISDDVLNFDFRINNEPEFLVANAKNIEFVKNVNIDAVITSPPYLNGTNYFRNTKLELWFLRYIQFENDLRYLRNQALTSGINDVKKDSDTQIDSDVFERSHILKNAYDTLTKVTYDKRIPKMINNYFSEMYSIFRNLLPLVSNKAKIIIDIGDSIFAGVHIPTDKIIIELFAEHYHFLELKEIRKRRSKNNMLLHQTLLVLEAKTRKIAAKQNRNFYGIEAWQYFKENLPHHNLPYSKKNWGHPNHSLCSYQGKLKPAIAYHLINTFIPPNGKIFDPFSGVGTIPFEAALNGIYSYSIDISLPAYYTSMAKISINDRALCSKYIEAMKGFIENNNCTKKELNEAKIFGFNRTLSEYYEEHTLKEIILARRFIKENTPRNSSEMLVVASLLHILHGNRPYALSRRSHPIVPYAPQGDFEYKNLIIKLTEKVNKSFNEILPEGFLPGKIFNQDATNVWPHEINNLDAIVTSPPFFDSTRFYLANWIRIWFSGWSQDDFKYQINSFIEERQKKDFSVYEKIFRQGRERLKNGGVFVLHLGKSNKCDMARELKKISKLWFSVADIFIENVEHCESHGIRDKGTVTSHQYLVLI
jgi:tRNA G10  N-methylase Trm11